MTLPPTVAFSEKCKRIFRSDADSLSLFRVVFFLSLKISANNNTSGLLNLVLRFVCYLKILFDLIQTKVNNEQSI